MPAKEYWNSFFDPDCVLSRLDCNEGCGDVLEFGCGYGLFTEAAASRTRGTVHALDIDPEMIEATRIRLAKSSRLRNVHLEQCDFLVDGCGRPDQSIDYAMVFNLLHIEAPVALLREAWRATVTGGKVAVIHWNYDPTTPRGPSMDIRPRPEDCRSWLEQAGFQSIRFESLPCCRYHYGLVAAKPSTSPRR